jgi:hypothetical protein
MEEINPIKMRFACADKLNLCTPNELIGKLKLDGGGPNTDL